MGDKIMRRTGLALPVLAMATTLALPAFGQQGGGQATPAGTGDTPLDEITVTANKEPERAVDALAGVTVVNRNQLQRQRPQRIDNSLNQIPGVNAQVNPDDPATAINIRGLQDFGRVAVTVDGSRQNFQRSGHNADGAFFLDPAFVRVIDVTRGPVANIYGSGAIGGVVSFRTVEPKDVLKSGEKFAAEFNGTLLAGNQNGGNGSAIGAFRVGNVVSGLLGFSYRNLGSYKDGAGIEVPDSGQELKSGIAKLEIDPGNGHKVLFGGHLQKYNFNNGTGTIFAPRRSNDVQTHNVFVRYTFSRPDTPWLNLKANIYDTSTNTKQIRLSGTPAQIGSSRYFKINTRGFDVHNTSKFYFGENTLFVTYGVDAFRDKVRTSDPLGSGDEFTPGGQRTVFGSFVQAHLRWGRFDVVGAARYDHYKLENQAGTIGSSGSRISPKFTFGFSIVDGVKLYATYAEGYRAPAITETLVSDQHPPPATFTFIPNPGLKPEVGKTLEAGVNLKFDNLVWEGDKFRAKLSVYQNRIRDFIEGVYSDPGLPCGAPIPGACADATFMYQNIANARIRGVEVQASYDARRWFVNVAGSLNRGDNLTANEPLQSIYPAKLVIGGGARFLNEKFVVGGRVSMFAAQNRLPVSAAALASKEYALVDLYASYEFAKDMKAFVRVDNIGNVRYRRFRYSQNSPGTVVKFGLFARFGS